MSDIAIKVEGLGKQYKIGRQKNGDLRSSFGHFITRFKQKSPNPQSPTANSPHPATFWALKDISFEVKQGEAIGIIGRNGAGKSTLLKILSRITKPTTGRFEINGRVSSLLEVGTGFHMELTGRENIYLNGTILGMRRREIKAKFDEIVAFSGVEEFIDTPVKHYSSGMKVRLAFSVAAHLEPEILIIDEVLAVGDAEFQKKCLGKMEDVAGQGRTVIFVSHNMGAVEALCNQCMLLYKGQLATHDETSRVVMQYVSEHSFASDNGTFPRKLGNGLNITNFELSSPFLAPGDPLTLQFALSANKYCNIQSIGIFVLNNMEERLAIIDLRRTDNYCVEKNGGLQFNINIAHIPFIEGIYSFGLFLGSNLAEGNYGNLARLEIKQRVKDQILPYPSNVRGRVELDYHYEVQH